MGQRGGINLRDNLIRIEGGGFSMSWKDLVLNKKFTFFRKETIELKTISVLILTIQMISREKKRSPELRKVVTCADGRDVKIRLEDWWALYELSTLGLRSMAGTRDCHHRTPTDSLQSQGSTNDSIRDIDYGCAFSFWKNFPVPPPMMSFWWNQLLTDLWVCSLIPNARIYITAKDELLSFHISCGLRTNL